MRRRNAPHGNGSVGSWSEPGHDLLDLGLLLAAGRTEHLAVVVGSQVRPEKPCRREMQPAVREHVEHDGKAPRRAGDFNSVVGLALGHGERIAAIDEEGRIALTDVHLASVQFRQVGDDARGLITLTRQGSLEAGDERRIREFTEGNEQVVLHARVVARAPDALSRRARRVDQ